MIRKHSSDVAQQNTQHNTLHLASVCKFTNKISDHTKLCLFVCPFQLNLFHIKPNHKCLFYSLIFPSFSWNNVSSLSWMLKLWLQISSFFQAITIFTSHHVILSGSWMSQKPAAALMATFDYLLWSKSYLMVSELHPEIMVTDSSATTTCNQSP